MLKFKYVTIKNFLSIGNVEQTVDLDRNGFTLVIGENIDLGSGGQKNGCGKSALLSAISYGLYGQSLNNIKVNNLINNINQKNMSVSIEFEKDGHTYRLERGRKPNFFKYIVDNKSVCDDSTDEAQGENKETQKQIDELLGMSHTLFKHLVALNTYAEPFLSLGAAKQREIIEELLGITQLSQKAEVLKELVKTTKTNIDQEELRIRTIKQSNERIQQTIQDIALKAENWSSKQRIIVNDLASAIEKLELLDIDVEIQSHRDLEKFKQLSLSKSQVSRDLSLRTKHLQQISNNLNIAISDYSRADKHECPTCGQDMHDIDHEKIKLDLGNKVIELDTQVNLDRTEVESLKNQLVKLDQELSNLTKPVTTYSNLEEALNHRNTLDQLVNELERELNAINPYIDQNESLFNTLQDVNYDTMNKLIKDRDHQEFLLKLLTNKDSFIRKRIIDQNLAYLNIRLNEYLDKLGLPHHVKFINDLSVEISLLGQSLDFYNFSRGERTRLILGLCWAFRDIFENTRHATNLMFIDELLDDGIDQAGIEGAVAILKAMERERHKNIFVVSHREELINRVNNVLTVVKENSFTRFEWDYTPAV